MSGRWNPIKIARASRRLAGLSLNALALHGETRRIGRDPGYAKKHQQLAELSRVYAEKICKVHGVRMHTTGQPHDATAIYVANHLGYMDPLLIVSQAPMFTISKMEIADWPLLGKSMRASGALFVKRGDVHSAASLLRKAIRLLKSGVSVLNFPEGTTTCGEGVLEFRRGIFGIARLIDIPVVPVCVQYPDVSLAWYGDMLFFPHYLKTAFKTIIEARVCFGDPVSPKEFDSPETLARHCRFVILKNYKEIQRPLTEHIHTGCDIQAAYRINSPVSA
jgi:1-acyl-sn-glycerol-3-phosphate acyltransferase